MRSISASGIFAFVHTMSLAAGFNLSRKSSLCIHLMLPVFDANDVNARQFVAGDHYIAQIRMGVGLAKETEPLAALGRDPPLAPRLAHDCQ